MRERPISSIVSHLRNPRTSVKAGLVILVAIYVILVVTGSIAGNEKLGPFEYALIAFVVLFVADFFEKLAELSFGKEGLTVRLNSVETRQQQTENTLEAIQIALTGLVNKYEYIHLQKLEGLYPDDCRYGNIFFDEIRRLDSIGFVTPTEVYRSDKGFNAIREDHEHDLGEFHLKQYVEITEQGKAYLAIRKKIEAANLVRS